MTFDQWFNENCKGMSAEAYRVMQMAWNAALSDGDKHFFVEDLAKAAGCKSGDKSWNELIEYVEGIARS